MGDFYQITLNLQILSNSIIIKDWILHNRIYKIKISEQLSTISITSKYSNYSFMNSTKFKKMFIVQILITIQNVLRITVTRRQSFLQ